MTTKRKKNIVISIAMFTIIILYGSYNFTEDKNRILEIKTLASLGSITRVLEEFKKTDRLSNPIVNYKYQEFKTMFYTRFVTQNEVFTDSSDNVVVNDIAKIYRTYWREQLLKKSTEEYSDSLLYQNILDYITSNQLTNLPKDSLINTIKNDNVLTEIITSEGFYSRFLFLNSFQDLMIWENERKENFEVELPNGKIATTVVFIDGFILKGYSSYATMESSETGGWAAKEESLLYCNANRYNVNSENFKVSFLKHESIHFVDLNKYPKLSSADLEYRAKLVELIYCTEESIYDRIQQFINGASNKYRNHSHPYANYCLIQHLSNKLLNTAFETDFNKWEAISVLELNKAAKELFEMNELELGKDNLKKELIFSK